MIRLSFCFVLVVLKCAAAEPADPNWQSCCGTGQTSTDAVSPLETVSATPEARVLLSTQVGHWDAGSTHATITALDVEAPAGQRARGLRIDLSRPGAAETVYAEESVFPLLQQTLQIYSERLPAAAGMAGKSRDILWNQFFDYKGGTVHPLAVGLYFDAASNGPGMTIGKSPKSNGSKGMFDFPKYLPKDLEEVVAAGIAALKETRFETLARSATARVVSSDEIARIEAGDAKAVFSALKVQDTTNARLSGMGIRVTLTDPGTHDEVYLDNKDIGKELAGLDEMIAGMKSESFTRIGIPNGGNGEYSSALFIRKRPEDLNIPPPLYVAYYGRGGENGLKLSSGTQAYYFPNKMPSTVRDAIEQGLRSLAGLSRFAPAESPRP